MLKMYAVRDKAVEAFMQPFFVRANGEAIRSFADAVNDSNSPFYKHPGDFELYALGDFDPSSGRCDVAQGPIRVIAALDLVNKM